MVCIYILCTITFLRKKEFLLHYGEENSESEDADADTVIYFLYGEHFFFLHKNFLYPREEVFQTVGLIDNIHCAVFKHLSFQIVGNKPAGNNYLYFWIESAELFKDFPPAEFR